MNRKMKTILGLLTAVLMTAPALADVSNGDFESGGSDWTPISPPGWGVDFPPAGGNPDGHAVITSPPGNLGGVACITQTIMCGEPGGGTECTIGFDYMLEMIDAMPGSARIVATIDGVSAVVASGATSGWEFVSFVVPCGEHTIELCLEVDPEGNVWRAKFDNVRAECTGVVSNDSGSWDALKAIYR